MIFAASLELCCLVSQRLTGSYVRKDHSENREKMIVGKTLNRFLALVFMAGKPERFPQPKLSLNSFNQRTSFDQMVVGMAVEQHDELSSV